jgi:hypothetical protein
MRRVSKIESLSVEHLVKVQRCIRAHRYQQVDMMLVDLSESGIQLSRSPLYRYVAKLRNMDAMVACGDEGTIITITERVSGKVMVVKSSASADAITSLIQGAQG